MSSPTTASTAGSGGMAGASYPVYPSSAPSSLEESVHVTEGGGDEEDDDGLPPLTLPDYVRLFEACSSVPLSQQAELLLMTGGGVSHQYSSTPHEPCTEEDFSTLSHTQPSILRRIVWQRFLGLLHGDNPIEWEKQAKANRAAYAKLQEEQQLSAKRLTSLDPQKFHPLASTADNPWSQKQQNDCLLEEIWKDIERTFADRALFCRDTTRKSLQRILFTWSRQNQDVSYKQGMNELLAIFYLICSRENLGSFSRLAKQVPAPSVAESPVSEPMRVLLSGSLDDIEADTFSLFNSLMNAFLMKAAYLPAPPPCTKPAASSVHTNLLKGSGPLGRTLVGGGVGVGGSSSASHPQQSAILWRCSYIFDTLLRKMDSVLYEHLKEIEIQPQLFLLRWLRLLFSREFHVQDTILIWDALFADAYLQLPSTVSPADVALPSTSSSPSLSSSITRSATTGSSSASSSGIGSMTAATRTSGVSSTTRGTDLLHSSSTTRLSATGGGSGPVPLLGGGGGLGGSSLCSSHQPDKLGAAASAKLPLTDFFALAMLKFVRENLLDSDETLCLRRLLKFPPIESLQPLILLALSLRSGQRRKRPETARGDAVPPTSPSSVGSTSRAGGSSSAKQDDNGGLYRLSPDTSMLSSSSLGSSDNGGRDGGGEEGEGSIPSRKHSHADHTPTRKHTPLSPGAAMPNTSSHSSVSSFSHASRGGSQGGPISVGGGGLTACVVTSTTTPQAQLQLEGRGSHGGMSTPNARDHHRHKASHRKQADDSLGSRRDGRTRGVETDVLLDTHGQKGDGTSNSERTVLSGTALSRHVAGIVATLQEAAATEAQTGTTTLNGSCGSSPVAAPSPSHTVSVLLSSALSRLVLVQRVLEGDVEYNPSLFADTTGEITRTRTGHGTVTAENGADGSTNSSSSPGIEPMFLGAQEGHGSECIGLGENDKDPYGGDRSRMADIKTARRPLPVVSGNPSTAAVLSPSARGGLRPTLL